MKPFQKPTEHSVNRRHFLKTTSAAGLGLAGGLHLTNTASAAEGDTLKIALIGCGGRGTGAASQALNTGNVKLVAMADAFEGRLQSSLDILKK